MSAVNKSQTKGAGRDETKSDHLAGKRFRMVQGRCIKCHRSGRTTVSKPITVYYSHQVFTWKFN